MAGKESPRVPTPRLHDQIVLIVDDDEDILSSMELAMRTEGATTITARDGTMALSHIQQQDPDAVILDMMLPRASGLLVMEKLREFDDPPPVVMVTANEGKRHQSFAESLGVQAYLVKPVSLQRLVDTVVRLIEEDQEG